MTPSKITININHDEKEILLVDALTAIYEHIWSGGYNEPIWVDGRLYTVTANENETEYMVREYNE